MNIINSAIFLFVLLIGIVVPLSILPKLTLTAIVLLLFAVTINFFSGDSNNSKRPEFYEQMNYSNIHVCAIGLLLVSFVFVSRMFGDIGGEFSPTLLAKNAASILLHYLFFIFILNTRSYLMSYLKIYVFFVVIMCICAVLADLLLIFKYVSPYVDHININKMTNNSFTRDIGSVDSYIFPYYLSFIITAGGKLSLAGVEFFRITGWAHEPTSFSLLIMPALFILIGTTIIKNNLFRIFGILIIVFAWFLAASVGSAIAIILICGFIVSTLIFTKKFPLILTSSIVVIILTSSLVILLNYQAIIYDSTLLSSKINFESHTVRTALEAFTFFLPNYEKDNAFYFSFLFVWLIIFLFLFVIIRSLLLEKELNIYSLILLYVIIHSMKGSQSSIFTLIFPFFWFYVAYFSSLKDRHMN
jgi:hypothetical protein